MKTTIELPAPLFQRVTSKAATLGQSVQEFVAGILEREISDGTPAGGLDERLHVPVLKCVEGFTISPTREQLNDF